MKIHLGTDGVDYASFLAVEEFGGPGFTWEIVTRERRTSAVVAMERGEERYKTREVAAEAGLAALRSYVFYGRGVR